MLRVIAVALLVCAASVTAHAQVDASVAVQPGMAVDAGVAVDAGAVVVDGVVDAGPVAPADAGVAPDAPAVEGGPDGGAASAHERLHARPPIEWDADGDGTLEPAEVALQQQAAETFAEVPVVVTPEALDARPARKQLAVRSLTVARFRAMVKLTRAKVLARLAARIHDQGAARMTLVAKVLALCSLSGLLLLLLPVVMARRYPGKLGVLVRYSALSALTFMLIVGLFGAVSLVQRGAQSALADQTSPQFALASGFFDTLHDDADELVVVGKELFAPTLVQLQGSTEEQPAVVLIANGRKLVRDAGVFLEVARQLGRLAFVVGLIPSVLLVVSLSLFLLAIKPTLVTIVVLPAQAASGDGASGGDVFSRSMRRVGNELLATLASLAVLVVISVLAGAALGRVVQPALATLISYFTIGVMYLRFVEGASSDLVLVMLLSVVAFLVLNLAVIVVATTFFLAKVQRIFQQRFHDKIGLGVHRRFWTWGTVAMAWALLFPLLYMWLARLGIDLIRAQVMAGVGDPASVRWNGLLLAGPLLLVVGFVVALWAGRAFAAIRFLVGYDVQGGSSGAMLGVAETAATTFGRP